MIKVQYISTMAAMLVSASGMIFQITGRTEYFIQILGAMTIGAILGLGFYGLCIYFGVKLSGWATAKVQSNKKAYLKIK
jgi:hypothetical protein